jgi:hypothetical protein
LTYSAIYELGTNILVQPAASVLFCHPEEERNRFLRNIRIVQASRRHLNTPKYQNFKCHTTDGPVVCLHVPHYLARSEEMRNKKINSVEQEKDAIKYGYVFILFIITIGRKFLPPSKLT